MGIVGMSPSKAEAPFADPAWELWGLAWDADALRMARAFELHDDWNTPRERLEALPVLYMQANALPHARRYPIEDVAAVCGEYLESSVAYMLALAIFEGADEIGLWGIDMRGEDEYGYQRPNMEYLIGLARGKGITVRIHESSPLCRPCGQFGYAGRYGRRA